MEVKKMENKYNFNDLITRGMIDIFNNNHAVSGNGIDFLNLDFSIEIPDFLEISIVTNILDHYICRYKFEYKIKKRIIEIIWLETT